MGEKRKSSFVFLLKKEGKNIKKIEIFPKSKYWPDREFSKGSAWSKDYYRIRLNGKWFGKEKYSFFNKYEIRDMLWRTIVKRQLFNLN